MKEEEKIKDYEEEILDTDEIIGTDIKINPDYYIHTALLKAQKALIKDNLQEGLIQFRFLVEHVEVLCQAAKRVPVNYLEEIDKFKDSSEYRKETDSIKKSTILAQKKLYILLTEVFESKTSTQSLFLKT